MEGIRGAAGYVLGGFGKGGGGGGDRAQRTARARDKGRKGAERSKTHHRWSELEPAGNAMHTVTPCDTLQI